MRLETVASRFPAVQGQRRPDSFFYRVPMFVVRGGFTLAALVVLAHVVVSQPAGKPSAPNPDTPAPHVDRALYVWKLSSRLARADELLTTAGRYRVRRLYLGVNRAALAQPVALGNLVALARTKTMQVHAVVAENSWALAGKHRNGLAHVDRILAWHGKQKPDRRLAGVHLDVEVHALPAFKSARRACKEDGEARKIMLRLLHQWLDFVASVRQRVREADATLEVSVAVPPWLLGPKFPYRFVRVGRDREVMAHLMSLVDEVVVMAYTSNPHVAARLAREEMVLAEQFAPVRVRVAVNVSPRAPAEETLFRGGPRALRSALAHLEKTFAGKTAFSGTAIHMLDGLEQWERSD